MSEDKNSWTQYQKLVLAEINRLSKELKELNRSLRLIHIDIAMLKVKSSLWGALGGLVSVGTILAIRYISSPRV